MRTATSRQSLASIAGLLMLGLSPGLAEEPQPLPKAFLDGSGPGWSALGELDFVNVNCDPQTWTWSGGEVRGTGLPVGVARTRKPYTNFELVAQWRHLRSGGNSGFFVWASDEAIEGIKPGTLPRGGIEAGQPTLFIR